MRGKTETKRVCVVTTTRADWGLLQPLAAVLRETPGITLQIVASNMHLLEAYGMTVREISDAGFQVDERVPMDVPGDDETSRVIAMSRCMEGLAGAFSRLRPDAVLLLGDRYEMLAVAAAAAVMHLPIIHIAGGEISEGANDDSFRHAITKLATLHLTATETYRRRVIQMGEEPGRVVNTGAIGVWNALNIEPCPLSELEEFLDMRLDGERIAVVTYHPATNETGLTPVEAMDEFLAALDALGDMRIVITYPNNDAGGASMIERIESFVRGRANVRAVPSLGMRRYHSLLRHAVLVAGNSSSGIVEVPSYGIPTVDVGIRQRGRIAASSVIHCGPYRAEIADALVRAAAMDCRNVDNPYFKSDTLGIMTRAILTFLNSLPLPPKHFYDLHP